MAERQSSHCVAEWRGCGSCSVLRTHERTTRDLWMADRVWSRRRGIAVRPDRSQQPSRNSASCGAEPQNPSNQPWIFQPCAAHLARAWNDHEFYDFYLCTALHDDLCIRDAAHVARRV